MNLFRDGFNSVPIENHHYDEILEVSQNDSENLSVSSATSDASPPKKTRNLEEDDEFHQEQQDDHQYENDNETFGRKEVTNTFYDEALEIEDDDSIHTKTLEDEGIVEVSGEPKAESPNVDSPSIKLGGHVSSNRLSNTYDNNDEDENEEDQLLRAHLSPELLSLFDSINKYEPREIEIKTELKCFIPPYIPSIGEVDPFLKVPRPDRIPDGLGLSVLDEPGLIQSDPAVLELQLRAKMKKKRRSATVVRSIENASNNPYDIEKWIQSVEDLHRSKPPPEVLYRFPPPDVEEVTSPFPSKFALALEDDFSDALDPELDLSLEEYAKLICALLDIPVKGGERLSESNLIQNLHFLFCLTIEHNDLRLQSDTISAL